MKREKGWYWVKVKEDAPEWEVVEWYKYSERIGDEEGCWWVDECPYQDADLYEIDERRIVRQEP